jgi:hypothetical protein
MVVSSIFAVVLSLGMRSFHQSSQVWRKISATTEASVNLRRATARIQTDLLSTSPTRVRTYQGPSTLSGFDGDAFWFLSALDDQGNFQRTSDGSPFWQRTVLYYTVTPSGHQTAGFGSGGSDPQGYEDHCPYKLLIRKEIDWGTPTDPLDDTTSEELMSALDVTSYLTRPAGYSLAGMESEVGVQEVQLVARDLLSTRCLIDSGNVQVKILAGANERARKEAGFGRSSLSGKPFIHELEFTVVPRIDGD